MFEEMKKGLLIFLLVVWGMMGVWGQVTFEKTYGGIGFNEAFSVQQTNDGSYIFCGFTSAYGAGMGDVYIIKTDTLGTEMWSKTFGGPELEVGKSVHQTTDGGYIILATSESFGLNIGTRDAYLIKLNANGDTTWSKVLERNSDNTCMSIDQTDDGGFIIGGYGYGGLGMNDLFLIKTDSGGNFLWQKFYGGPNDELDGTVHQTLDSGYILIGDTRSFGAGESDFYVIKTDTNGDTIWSRTYGGLLQELGYDGLQTSDTGYIMLGSSNSFGNNMIYLIKIDLYGDTVWSKIYNGNAGVTRLKQTSDGGYVIASTNYNSSEDVYLIKTNSIGDTLWAKTYGSVSVDERSYSISQTSDGGYIITGLRGQKIYSLKMNSNGNTSCSMSNPFPIQIFSPPTQIGFPPTMVSAGISISINPTTSVDTGCITNLVCTSTDIDNLIHVLAFLIYPNPTTGSFNIECNTSTPLSVTIYDVAGREVYQQTIRTQKSEIRNSFSPGVYFVELREIPQGGVRGRDGERVSTQKLIIQ
jgi:hypothetical protein